MLSMNRSGVFMRFTVLLFSLLGVQGALATTPATLDVIAVEYPPYTSSERADDGLVFRELRNYLIARNLPITIRARFLPPARAQNAVDTVDWCMALYPPSENTPHVFRRIGNSKVTLGLARIRRTEAFSWENADYFKDKRIALLRTVSMPQAWKPFEEAGAEFVFVEAMDQALNMVLQGFADYAVVDSGGLEAFDRTRSDGPELELSRQAVQEFPVGVYLSARCSDILGPPERDEKGAAEKTAPLQN